LDILQIQIHPKELRNNPEKDIKFFEDTVNDFQPDIIHFQYWDIANTLSKLEVCKNSFLILTHHNQKNLLTHDWNLFDMIVVHTKKAKEILEKAGYKKVEVIQHGINIEKFRYNENYDNENRLLGYCGRIVPWKGLYEILKAAKELNTEVAMMGHIDKPDYWNKCMEFDEQMDIRFNTPNEEQANVYHEMACYIGNSCDNIEEGTLPLLEAMACGVPVITTPSGEAKDIIKHGENGIFIDFEDYESLKRGISMFLNMTLTEKNAMREKAWNTVKIMNEEVMARKYERVYYKVLYKNDLVSVIIPTCNRSDTITKVLDGYAKQTYKPIELVAVIDDVFSEEYESALYAWKKENDIPIKWTYTMNTFYGLAQARNTGIFLSSGHYLIFNDDRYVPKSNTVENFIGTLKKTKALVAVWGDKGAGKRDFMENFFAIRKKHMADAGMFNERGDKYGFQSQEVRERFRNLGFDLIYEPEAKADTIFGTHNKSNKKYEILHSKTKLWLLRN
jgi:glycosyltransferase involved in cell wall biosynthesis